MQDWSKAHDGGAVMARLDTRLGAACAKEGTDAACKGALGAA